MNPRIALAAAVLGMTTSTLSAQITPELWKGVNGNDQTNTNSGFVGIRTNPSAPLHIRGDTLIDQGDLRLRGDNDSIRFSTSSGGNSAMIEMFTSGTNNANRMVLAHSSSFPDWGLQYRDNEDAFYFRGAGVDVASINLASQAFKVFGQTELGQTTISGPLNCSSLVELQSDLRFLNDNVSLRFGNTSGGNAAMMEMFESAGNANRMLVAHSAAFPTWGLQYRDSGDEFHFLRNGTSVFEVDLGDTRIATSGDFELTTDTSSIVFPVSSGSNDAMIKMFAGGTSNADRMVIAHSSSFANWGLQYRDSVDEFRFIGAGNPAMTVELSSREVGIRTDNPAAALQVGVAGDGSSALANAWNVFSSRDYKKNIVELDEAACADALDKVVSTPVFKFHYKEQGDEEQARIGLIVEESPEEMLASEVQIDGETKAVDLTRYIGMLHAALKAQQEQIEDLRDQQSSIDALRDELEALRSETR